MQTVNERNGTKVIRSFVVTTLFCVVIAFVTQSIWPSEFAEHLLISIGYGYSAVISSHLIGWLAPQVSSYLLTGASLAGAMLFGTMNAHFLLNKYDDFASLEQLKPVVILGFIFSCTCFVFFYAHEQKLIAQKEAEIAKRKQSEHEKAMIQSQLRQLQSQIEPHFLFNTLANVSVLIEQDPAQARLMLEKLTDLLRGTLKSSRQEQSTLQSELDLVDAYLAIQKVRLGQRLDYKIDNSLLSDINLPPLVLQPLVENAIQHGIEPKAEGGCVEIVTQEAGDSLVIEVTDSGVGIHGSSNHAGHGVGLENTQQRLKALFGDEASLALLEVATGGVKAKVSIPLVQLRG